MSYDPNEPRDKGGKWTSIGGSNPRRWGRMNSTEKAKLAASAQFKTKMSGGKSVGRTPAKVQGDERMFIKTSSGKTIPVFKYEDSAQAVAIQTAKALDKDFHHARQKADQDAMHAALAKSKVPVVKYPAGKPPRYGHKGKMK